MKIRFVSRSAWWVCGALAAGACASASAEDTVHVYGQREVEGTEEQGYKVKSTTATGPWGQRDMQDTPYSISVVPSDLIENLQMSRLDGLARVNPLTQTNASQNLNNIGTVNLRGFNVLANTQDGIRSNSSYGVSLEDVERVEVFSGLSGFLYGGGNVGGTINYVLKRPTSEQMTHLTVGNYGEEQYYAHADIGGPIDSQGRFGYRANLFYQNGETPIDFQRLKRMSASVSFDYHVADNLVLQLDTGYQDFEMHGGVAFWTTASPAVKHGPAPDVDRPYNQHWAHNDTDSKRAAAHLTWEIDEHFTLRTAYKFQRDSRSFEGSAQNIIQANGTITQSTSAWAPNRYFNDGAFAFLDSRFDIGSIKNTLTVGYSRSRFYNDLHQNNSSFLTFTGLTFDDIYRPQQPFPPHGTLPMYTPSRSSFDNFVVGDDIRFNDQWSALVGASRSSIQALNAFTGSAPSNYDRAKWTPTGSVIYRPLRWLSTYVTYIEGLEQGTIVGQGFTNTGQVLAPLVDKQYELGAKANVGAVLLTAAVFRLDKANQFSDLGTPLPTFVQDGRQIHKGVEFTASGKVTDLLTLYGGFSVLNATVERANNPALLDKHPTNVANNLAKVYAEMAIPGVQGLTLTGGAYWNGRQFADTANIDKLDGYFLADLGARYRTQAWNQPLSFILNVQNLADKNYWTNASYLGSPRTISFAADMKF